jgi:hypothetical protein
MSTFINSPTFLCIFVKPNILYVYHAGSAKKFPLSLKTQILILFTDKTVFQNDQCEYTVLPVGFCRASAALHYATRLFRLMYKQKRGDALSRPAHRSFADPSGEIYDV